MPNRADPGKSGKDGPRIKTGRRCEKLEVADTAALFAPSPPFHDSVSRRIAGPWRCAHIAAEPAPCRSTMAVRPGSCRIVKGGTWPLLIPGPPAPHLFMSPYPGLWSYFALTGQGFPGRICAVGLATPFPW